MNIREKKLPIEALEQIDDRCAEFEKAWQTGSPVSIESILADDVADEQREVLLAELVVLELDYRRRRGESPNQQEFLDRFPEHAEQIRAVFDDAQRPTGAFVPPSIEHVAELFPALDVIELLGAGGMGAVYKAKQKGLDRVVAIKILPAEFAHDNKFALRFTREARTLAKLNHPSIVSVYEFGNIDDTFFFLMEYVDGPTLRDMIRVGKLDSKHALAIVPDLCDALQYAHDNGVIHRDIKPENILLTKVGQVKIVDFGLSRIMDNPSQASNLTGTRQVMGTPRYMAPEQFEGAHHVDHRADIYSLGVVFYELLTGELPVGRFAAPSKKVSIDVRVDEVVLRTLEKEPRRRYQTASQVKSDLESIADSDDQAVAVTLAAEDARAIAAPPLPVKNNPSEADQELAGRLLLTRRDLMGQVEASLRPLFRWQLLQILVGVGLVALGAFGWTQNTHVPHRLTSGLIVHLYGIAYIAAAIAVMVRIKKIDYSESVQTVRQKLGEARRWYLRLTPLIGFPWWLMWIPVTIAAGFDQVMHPNSLVPSLIIGVLGMLISLWLYYRMVKPSRDDAEVWQSKFAGSSFRNATSLLNQIAERKIQ
ncbi:serine/threonine protein kinase [Roseimaritima ulvae]|uniref:Serine/threonine-protein kinase PknB n=1 Tax=Roseimaritima ulvae TaxID=980254 RepID=A0A5B9QPC9_9BACT|nr:serine/threonine-protein kinase [Roseimaritima ulvae]QEG40878.1 Serine/threonine-protein kinase PknB [Roseimaritima ulvae]